MTDMVNALSSLTWPGALALIAIVVCVAFVLVVFFRELLK